MLFTPIEDATVGLWLSALNLRHVGHRRFRTLGTPCCFEPAVRRDGDQVVSQFQLQVWRCRSCRRLDNLAPARLVDTQQAGSCCNLACLQAFIMPCRSGTLHNIRDQGSLCAMALSACATPRSQTHHPSGLFDLQADVWIALMRHDGVIPTCRRLRRSTSAATNLGSCCIR